MHFMLYPIIFIHFYECMLILTFNANNTVKTSWNRATRDKEKEVVEWSK